MNEQEQGMIRQSQPAPSAVADPAPAMAPGQAKSVPVEVAEAYKAISSGGGWFYWIAGLSLVNTVINLFNASIYLLVGLGATLAIDSMMQESGGVGKAIGLVINLVIMGIYVVFGYFACKGAKWAFITGMILYGLDALLMVLFQEWFAVAIHAYALFSISRGFLAINTARQFEAKAPAGMV